MKCPNCKETYSTGTVCPYCGVDAVLFSRTRTVSMRLYNKGLRLAQERNLSGAAEALEESITFNKKNYFSRNLLGLVYYQMGRIADALMQWIISSSMVKEGNPAKRYIDLVHNSPKELDAWDDAVKMYNQARVYLQQNSDDLAIIQLKKALEYNPHFIDAINLLAFCCIIQKDTAKAVQYIEKVLKIDVGNPHALYYSEELHVTKKVRARAVSYHDEKAETRQVQPRTASPAPSYDQPDKKRPVIGGPEIIAFLAGVICTAAALLTLLMPAWVDEKDKTIAELTQRLEQIQTENKGGTATASDYETLQQENAELQQRVTEFEAREKLQQQEQNIDQAESMMDSDVENAAMLLVDIDTTTLPDDYLLKFNSLKEVLYPKAAQSFYNTARSQFLNNSFEEAQGNFEKCLLFSSGENFIDDCLYYLGKIAENKNDVEKAKTYYQRVINEYPESNQLQNAQNSLDTIAPQEESDGNQEEQ